ncbi:MAG: soluble lytic murein transglycosylase [Gammaproteobacteria bacterium]|jgi:soluble lytic murein transglycosylase
MKVPHQNNILTKTMTSIPNMIMHRFLLLFIVIFLQLTFSQQISAATIKEQRQQYLEAQKALKAGEIQTFTALSEKLREYPLYPYLRYNYIRPRLHKINDTDIKNFIDSYPDFISTDSLKTSWLKQLAKQGKWQIFLDNYTPQKDIKLRCQQLQARIKTNNQTYLLEDTRTLWLTGQSLPSECDIAFERLHKSELMTNELVWERIQNAMEISNTGLVNYLSKSLNQNYKAWVKRWLAMHHNPSVETKNPQYPDTAIAREILLYGTKRLAKQNINRSLSNWQTLKDNYNFTPSEINDVNLIIAVLAAKNKHPKATELLDNLNQALDSEEIFHWRLRTALKNKDWQKLYQWTNKEPPELESIKYSWVYWHGRALEEIGNIEKANESYASIADQRDYYGFLAADRIGAEYKMNHYPLPEDLESKNKVSRLPGIRRAHELFILYGNYTATSEWQHALRSMTNYQMQVAASIASQWGWHDRAIFTMGAAHAYDNLELRFPTPYRDSIEEYAIKRNLDIGWIFALMRSESAFIEKVKSPAGALGLMQVMPATGKLTAKMIGMNNFKTNDLLTAKKNIAIGTAYMKEMQDKFKGSHLLATAAYNAGPGRSVKWSPKTGCKEPDIWVEQIPFDETRAYVKRVLFYASIYDWRLGQQISPLKQRMTAIYPYNSSNSAQTPIPACAN